MPIYRLNASNELDTWERLEMLARNNQCGDLNALMANQDFKARVRVKEVGLDRNLIAHVGDFMAYVAARQARPAPFSMMDAASREKFLTASAETRPRTYADRYIECLITDKEKYEQALAASKMRVADERREMELRKHRTEWRRQASQYPERSMDELRRDDTRNEAVQAVFRRWPREEGARRIKHVDAWYAGIGPVEQRRLKDDVPARREAIRELIASLEEK